MLHVQVYIYPVHAFIMQFVLIGESLECTMYYYDLNSTNCEMIPQILYSVRFGEGLFEGGGGGAGALSMIVHLKVCLADRIITV